MADEAAVLEEDVSPAQSPLVTLSFQRDVNRKRKFLEAEPKALGITQIGLSLFNMTCSTVFLAEGISRLTLEILFVTSSLLVLIAGSVATAAQNLHLPVLRACLGMQIVACGASVFNMIYTMIQMNDTPSFCWHYYYDNETLHYGETCRRIEGTIMHFYSEGVLIQVVLASISITLAIYCCKVVKCCTPDPKMPVITVQAPPVQQ